MDFGQTPAQSDAVAQARAQALAFDAALRPPERAFWQAAGANGWLGYCLPTAAGGAGFDALTTVLVVEALGRAGVSRSALFAMGAHLFGCAMVVANHASAVVQQHWLPRLARGDAVGALALTEPAGGSDLADLDCTITEDGDTLILNGVKTLVSNAPMADLFIVSARQTGPRSALNNAALCVPRDTPGVSVAPVTGSLGLRDAPMGRVTFDAVRLPPTAYLGGKGRALPVILSAMQWERSCILAGFLGAADRDLVAVTGHLAARRDSKGSVLGHQAVLHSLAEVRASLESARWTLYRSAWALDQGEDPIFHPAASKLVVSRAIVSAARTLQEVMAGAGWLNTLGIASSLADVMGTLSASGSTFVQLNAIGARLARK